MLGSARQAFELAVRARVPLIALVSYEEARVEQEWVRPVAEQWRAGRAFAWSTTRGYVGLSPESDASDLSAPDPTTALEVIAHYPEPALFVLRDFHPYLDTALVLRKLRELAMDLPGSGKTILLLGPVLRVPDELEKDVTVIDVPPPDLAELAGLLGRLETELGGEERVRLTPAGRERLLRTALGLTAAEFEAVLARALVNDGVVADDDLALVLAEKKQSVRRSGILEFYEATEGMEQVGGLENVKAWLGKRYHAFTEDARRYGLSEPRGMLLLGIQGCGKSLVAKAVSQAWQMPLLRLDVGRVFGRYIGESEAGIRNAIRTAEAIAPAVLWIDEIEKGFAGAATQAHDTGVSARVLGTFLTWLQEKTKPVFVVATANTVHQLPPELLRKGRFDELFFVDLPAAEERRQIFAVHLRKRGREPERFDLEALLNASEGFTGAEIEQSIQEALHDAYADGRREPKTTDMLTALRSIVPLAVTMHEPIEAMRRWAASRARRASAE